MGKTAILAVKIIGDAKSAQQAITGTEQAASRLDKMGGAVKGALIGAGVAAAGFAVKLGVDSVRAAANLEQSVGAIDAVFKGGAGAMHEYANTAATTVGLSSNEYNELATVMGAQLKNGGTSLTELGGKTNDLIKTGADLSAMFGGSTREAVDALSSALKGERDPIERYGVSLNQAKIDAEAAALGFGKVGGTLSAEATQAATLSLIMKQTADAHGAFGRESDTLAHKQQVLSAQWTNLKAVLGNALLPVVSGVMGAMVNLMNTIGPIAGPALANMSASLSRIWTAAQPLVTQLVGALVPAFQQLWTTGIHPLVQAVMGMLVPAFQIFATTVIPAAIGAFRTIAPAFLTAYQALTPFVQALTGVLIPIMRTLAPITATAFSVVANIVRAALGLVTAIIRTATAILRGDWAAAWRGLGSIVSAAWGVIKALVSGGLSMVRAIAAAGMAGVRALFSGAWNAIKALVSLALSGIRSAISSGMSAARSAVSSALSAIRSAFSSGMSAARSVVSAGLSAVRSAFSSGMSAARSAVSSAMSAIRSAVSSGMSAFRSAISSGLSAVRSLFSGLRGQLVGIVTGIGGALSSAGGAIVSRLAAGIRSRISEVTGAVTSVMSAARNLIPHSPAKEGPFSGSGWGGWGESIGDEFALGLDRRRRDTARAAEKLVRGVAGSLQDAPGVDAGINLSLTPRRSATAGASAGTVINNYITVEGALDPVAVGRQVGRLINDNTTRFGR